MTRKRLLSQGRWPVETRKIYRVIDANFNRAKEGLRVCEDICRFFLNNKKLTGEYKALRHQLTNLASGFLLSELISARDIKGDVGKKTIPNELKRKNWQNIFFANSQRAKESVRVLEEFAKLTSSRSAQGLKVIRYKFYGLELKIVKRF